MRSGMKKLLEQIFKFGIVGGLCFLIDYGVYSALVAVFDCHHLIANFCSFTVSLVINYVLSMNYVFARRENMDRRAEFVIFLILSVIGLLISELLIWLCVDVVYAAWDALKGYMTEKAAKLVAKIFATGVVMVYNFVTRKLFLEKRNTTPKER